jgi:glycosyltransferase involved in cell wall biosynthesis
MKKISIVTPCFNEEDNILNCYEVVKNLFETQLADYTFEHIFADNCSTDGSEIILRNLAEKDSRVKVILNSRNFGAPRSLFNALKSATGNPVVAYLPADLQDPPEKIPEMVKLWEGGYEVVYGQRQTRRESFVLEGLRKTFYRTINSLASFQLPLDAGEFQVLDQKVVATLREFEDEYPYVRGMIAACGFRSVGVPYEMKQRDFGVSKANWYLLIDQAINGIISFSQVPLRLALFLGCAIAIPSLFYAFYSAIRIAFFGSDAEAGIPTLVVSLFALSGIQLIFVGLLGEYIGSIHAHVRKRPLVIERERINFPSP